MNNHCCPGKRNTRIVDSPPNEFYRSRAAGPRIPIESALEKARKAANGKDIRIGGGASTIRQFLQAGHIDEMHLAFAPVFLGAGEHLFAGPDNSRVDLPRLGFTETQTMHGKDAMHVILKKGK